MTSDLLFRVYDALRAASIPAALVGAGALAVHGVSRSTVDLDLLVTDARALDATVFASVEARVEVRRGDPDDPLAGVVRLSSPGERDVDVIVGRHPWQREIIASASPIPQPGGGAIAVAAPEGLVLLKLYAGGFQDLWDIEQLRAALGPSLDEAVDAQVNRLPRAAQEAWQQIRRR